MSDIVIQVENLSKKYIIGHQQQERYTTLRDTITKSAKALLSPFQNIKSKSQDSKEEFWALNDVSFEVKQGDRVGIIGRNGAGKSTLLKILSRITEPTAGQVRIKGRVASLLEVGTGFHPELTGRENIYLNGAILGMSKAEITRKFDEIVAFAEVEKFLDTPVKRYSSGMYVRLAFAVAAHLEPEILIVDEVLAVGDVRFQDKCLGKMKDISTDGRTVLFVSHNMGVIGQLCNKAIFLEKGKLIEIGLAQLIINDYMTKSLSSSSQYLASSQLKEKLNNKNYIFIQEVNLSNYLGNIKSEFAHSEAIIVNLKCLVLKYLEGVFLGISVKDSLGRRIFSSEISLNLYGIKQGIEEFLAAVKIPGEFLVPGNYYFYCWLHIPKMMILEEIDEICKFNIIDVGSNLALYEGINYGCVFAQCDWNVKPYV